jgi:DNA anti-recombination protein RmuC
MGELEETPRTYSGALLAAIAVSLLLALGGLIWSYTLSGKLTAQQQELADSKAQNANMAAKLRETDERLNVATDELKTSLGLTQKQLDTRPARSRHPRVWPAPRSRRQQVSAVSSAVTDVKTDVGGVKTDVAKTQSELAERGEPVDVDEGGFERPQQPDRPQSR